MNHKIKKYIFLTVEGYTFQPGSKSVEPDIENLQVIGFSQGKDSKDAFQNLLKELTKKVLGKMTL